MTTPTQHTPEEEAQQEAAMKARLERQAGNRSKAKAAPAVLDHLQQMLDAMWPHRDRQRG